MLCCMRDIVIKCEGIIFGGYVRDMIIHDHYSQTYYNESKQLSDASYNNPKVHPESWPMRTFMSDEMDIFLMPEKYKEFKAMIEKQDYQNSFGDTWIGDYKDRFFRRYYNEIKKKLNK